MMSLVFRASFTIGLLLNCIAAHTQITLESWKFQTGDKPEWSDPSFDDGEWANIEANILYENQGYEYNGYSWYRVRFDLPSSLREASYLKDSLRIFLGRVDDIDETFLNGIRIGGIGTFPNPDGSGALGFYDKIRRYVLSWDHPAIRWDEENVIAVRVYDGGGGGGLWGGMPSVGMVDLIDFVEMDIDISGFEELPGDNYQKKVGIRNSGDIEIDGQLKLVVKNRSGQVIYSDSATVKIPPAPAYPSQTGREVQIKTLRFPKTDNVKVEYIFQESNTSKEISDFQYTPYILTPPDEKYPNITTPFVYGAQAGKDFLWRITATGTRPMLFESYGLPAGLSLDSTTGIITGRVEEAGEYEIYFYASNAWGKTTWPVTLKIGDTIALTPPMGWNSWNAWGMSVSDKKVRESAEGLVSSGLINHGWTYMVIDDGWQGLRNDAGELTTNEKFPDMPALGDYLHSLGLKFGIYSSPGEISCGGLAGSLGHELQDVKTWAGWGVDYIKYDWCSYSGYLLDEYGRDQTTWTIEDQVYPFRKIADAIDSTDRDMVLSVANWGMNRAWEWADQTGGQLWRTTGDIEDNWESVSSIGFSQEESGNYSGPGGWGDPDMLVVGWLGWGDNQRQSRLTPAEQYAHISLWALLSAPMMIGCDLSKIDAFTYNLLGNYRVNAINRDPLGVAARVIYHQDDIMIWSKPLHDGERAVGIFNLSDEDRQVTLPWSALGVEQPIYVDDVWRQVSVDEDQPFQSLIFAHGVELLELR